MGQAGLQRRRCIPHDWGEARADSDAGRARKRQTFGVQAYIPPRDPTGAALLAGVVRSLAGEITRRGIATAEEVGIDTLERRIAGELERNDAVLLPPTVVGAWGRRVEQA